MTAMLAGVPCPQWLRDAFDAHQRRRMLVLQIWMLSDKTTATLALWWARAMWLKGGSVEGCLRAFKDALAAGWKP